MGGRPWMVPDRYIRNSPIFYVDRVQTPVFIAQGTLDFVPIEQGEEFFNDLRRLSKRAELVRYVGEGSCDRGVRECRGLVAPHQRVVR